MGTGLFNSNSKILKNVFTFRKLELQASDIFKITDIVENNNYFLKSLRSDHLVIKDFSKLRQINYKNIRDEIIIDYAKEIGLEFLKNENYLIVIITSKSIVIELSEKTNSSALLAQTIFTYLKKKAVLLYPVFFTYGLIFLLFLFTLHFYPDLKVNFLIFFLVMNLILLFNNLNPDYVLVPAKFKNNNYKTKRSNLFTKKITENYWYREIMKIISSLIVGLIATILGGYILNKLL